MRSLWILLPLALLSTAQLRADTVTLTSGEKITGTIKDETPKEIVIDVPVSASITDERVIQKSDITKIDKQQPDEIAYRALIATQPSTELSYSSQAYQQILDSLYAFEAKYPASAYLPEIKKLADTFQDEKKRVDAGQIKYLGRWLSSNEAVRQRIQIVALEYFNTMQQQAAAGDLVGAMQTFDTIEKNYATTRSFPAAVSLAQQALIRLQQDLAVRMQEVKADQDQLKQTINFTAEPEKSHIIASAKAEQDRATSIIDTALKTGAKWVPLIPRSQASIDALQKTATNESTRLASVPVATMNQSLQKVDAAENALASNDLKTADALLKDARALWATNEAAGYWSDQLTAKLATPSPTPVQAATPKPLPTVRPAAQIASLSAPTPAAVSDDKPFYMTITGAISIAAGILIVGGLAASYSQKRARKQAAQQ